MRVVFLDFDGVLNGARHFSRVTSAALMRDESHFDRTCVRRVSSLVSETGSVIVVSSSWRHGRSTYELAELLYRVGLSRSCKVVGKTADFSAGRRDYERGEEIEHWVQKRGVVESFVILDDDADMGDVGHLHVQTDPQIGITDADVRRAVRILGF